MAAGVHRAVGRGISVIGCGLAWRSLAKTSELQIRLVRASELNSHLNQMNLAAAGLAHETRNPLNIVRGLAQMISKQEDASPEIRIKSREIIDETDRVAAQLNEFINYSRPREVRRAATRLNAVVAEVTRALNYDLDEKKVRVGNEVAELIVEADEQLLRQALFNLVLNAIQAVPAERRNRHPRPAAGQRRSVPGSMRQRPGRHLGKSRGDLQALLHHERGRPRSWPGRGTPDRAGAWLGDRMPSEHAQGRLLPHHPRQAGREGLSHAAGSRQSPARRAAHFDRG